VPTDHAATAESGGPRRRPLPRPSLALFLALAVGASVAGCAGLVGDPAGGGDDGRPPPTEDPDVELIPEDDPERIPVDPLVRRLTRDEILFTVQDVLGVSLTRAESSVLPVDRPIAGFVNTASGQSVAPEHVLAYDALAETVVGKDAFWDLVADRVSCVETTDECAGEAVAGLGALLFRRPLGDRELTDFVALFRTVAELDGATFADAVGAVTRAMLQSPQFLYRIELEVADVDGLRRVEGYEMASRLSYLLWASAPDEALYAAADAGDLDTVEGVLGQVDRMLEDQDKTRRVLERFLIDWGRLSNLPDDDGLKAELVDGATAFYVDHVERGERLLDLFEAQRAMLTPTLAERYGIAPAGDGLRTYDLSDVPGRGGLLTQPGLLAGMTNADGGAIVARGLFLLGQVFCGDVPDPPASLQEDIDRFVEELPEDASDRFVAETRLERRECGTCHRGFDPLAYAFEQFDFRGAFRTQDEHGNLVRTDGWFPSGVATPDGAEPAYEGIDDYVRILRESPRAQRCFVRRQVEYALGAPLDRDQDPIVEGLRERLTADDGSWEALLRALVADDLFRAIPVRRGDR